MLSTMLDPRGKYGNSEGEVGEEQCWAGCFWGFIKRWVVLRYLRCGLGCLLKGGLG